MLRIEVPDTEYLHEDTMEIETVKGGILHLEHSLISISKWESKWEKPFLNNDDKTEDQILDYIKFMTLDSVSSEIYRNLTMKNFDEINAYIDAPMTATWFNEKDSKPNREVVTSEIIYYWMISFNIPFECQKWHINRLLTLIKVCNIKNAPQKKMSKKDLVARNRALNASRRKKYKSKG